MNWFTSLATIALCFAFNASGAESRQDPNAKRERLLREVGEASKARAKVRDPDLMRIQRALQKINTVDGGNISGGSDRALPVSSLALPEWSVDDGPQILSRFQLEVSGIAALHDRGLDGTGSAVAIIDSGLDPSSRAARNVAYFEDFTSECQALCDSEIHGSLVADLVTQSAPKTKLFVLKALGAQPHHELASAIRALTWVRRNHRRYGIKVVNMSLVSLARYYGSRTQVDEARDLVNSLAEENVLVVAPAGNDFRNQVRDFPANVRGSIAVGSLNHFFSGNRADYGVSPFSNYGYVPAPVMVEQGGRMVRVFALSVPKPEILFPGEDLLACVRECYLVSGTSFAAALFSGGLSLMSPLANQLGREDVVDQVARHRAPPSLQIHPQERGFAHSALMDRLFIDLVESRRGPDKN